MLLSFVLLIFTLLAIYFEKKEMKICQPYLNTLLMEPEINWNRHIQAISFHYQKIVNSDLFTK